MDDLTLRGRLLRRQGDMTGQAVADELGVPQSTAWKWLKGTQIPSDTYAQTIADWLGVDLGEVLRLLFEARQRRTYDDPLVVSLFGGSSTTTFESEDIKDWVQALAAVAEHDQDPAQRERASRALAALQEAIDELPADLRPKRRRSRQTAPKKSARP